MSLQDFTLFVYNLSVIPIIFFSILFLILTAFFLLLKKEKVPKQKLSVLPYVSVQIPTYNDPVAERCIRHCMDFDYPNYEIIIADDSTNLQTRHILKDFADKNPHFIKYIHRNNRKGFKAGALKEAMSVSKGEIVVIFDSDWIPNADFLKEITEPFADQKVALVQTRQSIYNKDHNLITRFASYILMVYHTIIMPINNRINCVFFCGTAGAFRRKAFEEAGGWNLNSLTEDCDLSVELLSRGCKSVYLEIETASETPSTFEGFVRQQMRWCYGNTRVLIDHSKSIFLKSKLTIRQRLMILYVTLGNIIAPAVVLMTFFGLAGWFIGDPKIMTLADVFSLVIKIAITSGFLIIGIVTLYKNKMLREFPQFLISSLTIGIVLAVANSIALVLALLGRGLHWHCTPKDENDKFA